MNYAMPTYLCRKDTPGQVSVFSCTVDIGGIRYIGGAAKTKKEAEIKAARTALLAIRSCASNSSENHLGHSQLTVIPCRKRAAEPVAPANGTANAPKPKKPRLKTKASKVKPSRDKRGHSHAENVGDGANINHEVELHACMNESGVQEMKATPFTSETMKDFENGILVDYQEKEKEKLAGEEGSLPLNSQGIVETWESTGLHSKGSGLRTVAREVSPLSNVEILEMSVEMNNHQYNVRVSGQRLDCRQF